MCAPTWPGTTGAGPQGCRERFGPEAWLRGSGPRGLVRVVGRGSRRRHGLERSCLAWLSISGSGEDGVEV